MNYPKISEETVQLLFSARKSLENSPLSEELKILLELRVSQINGCKYCIELHSREAVEKGIDPHKITELETFASSSYFSEAEKEGLSWAETLTNLDGEKRVEDTKLSSYFSEREVVDITLCISMMNMFNRIAISMK